MLEKTSYPELEEAIESQVEAEGLIYHSPWVLKLIQVNIAYPNYTTKKQPFSLMFFLVI